MVSFQKNISGSLKMFLNFKLLNINKFILFFKKVKSPKAKLLIKQILLLLWQNLYLAGVIGKTQGQFLSCF
ncbi:hypothetical protein SAMN02746062_02207 [Alysiella filiformis DSM 16848]|uniref:Uncharacterized protein n=1 Tax=Alysiella filiformis DSM 16848 TaxID=1120981 RepID=A0A286ENN8_9NEIS|nr:hypothetical protein SAMN02746062_02207 [Alysiella filiformis DSM 16848]